MALDTAMKIEEILKISLYVTSRDSQSETRCSSTPTRHLKFLDDQSMDKRTVHRILSEISEVFGYSVNATKLIPIELKKATSSGAHINEMLEAPIFSKPLILLYVLFMSFNRFFEFRKKKDEFPSILYDLKKLKFCVALGEEEYTKKIKVIEQTPEEKKQEDEFYKRLNRAYYSFKDVSAVKMMETIEETYEYFYALTFPKRNVDNFFSNDKFESFKKIEEFIKKNRKSQSEGTLRDFLAGTDVLSQLRLDKEFYQPFLKLLLIREELTSEEHCVIEKTIDDISAPELSEALIDNIKSYIKRYGLDENQSDSYREELLADFNPQARKRLENYLYIAQDYDHAF